MQTMLLDPATWDITLDARGNIALASSRYPNEPLKAQAYAQAQDAACEIKLFLGELFYDTSQGIPYREQILGRVPPVELLKAKYQQAALKVPGVTAAVVTIESIIGRRVTGQVAITNESGVSAVVRLT